MRSVRAAASGRLVPRETAVDPEPGRTPELLYVDADMVVVDKPAGWLTHPDGATTRPDVVSALTARLGAPPAVHHRLDVDTSGVLALSRSARGARRLAAAFERGPLEKRYFAVLQGTLAEPPGGEHLIDAEVQTARGKPARTRFRVLARAHGCTVVEAWPLTGRTHQLRLHFAARGAPVRGDRRYGDPLDVRAPRLLLHCARLALPAFDGAPAQTFEAALPAAFARFAPGGGADLRRDLHLDADQTCYRLFHGAADGLAGRFVDRYGEFMWVQHPQGLAEPAATPWPAPEGPSGIYRIDTLRDRSQGRQSPPALVAGRAAQSPLEVRENGIVYQVVLGPHLSTGLFLDQRPQRAWIRAHAGDRRVLNTFAHAGGFTVAAAVGGASQTVSIDLERDWLARIGPQLAANGLSPDPQRHDAIHGDVFDWLRRLGKRGERFDLVVLDPPSTSVGAKGRRWSAAQHYTELVALVAPLLAPGALLLTVTNHQGLTPARFAAQVAAGLPPQAALERVGALPLDYPEDAAPSVKSLVWRV